MGMLRFAGFLQLLAYSLLNGSSYGQSPTCPHHYTVQPPQDIACNPYPQHTMQMECAVTGSNLNKIQWYFSFTNVVNIFDDDVVEITNSSKYTLYSVASTEMLSVTLRVNNLEEETDTGAYFCRAFLIDGTMLDSPNAFELKESETYQQAFSCSPNVSLKSSMSVCAIPYVRATVGISTTTSDPSTTYSSIMLLPTNTATPAAITVGAEMSSSATTSSPSRQSSIPILYIIIGLVGFLGMMCVVLVFVICFMCKCMRKKNSNQAMEFGCISNQADLSAKRPDFPIFPMDPSVQSDLSKGSTGDYAEIGPALMSSVRFHSSAANNSHYSEINDVMMQPFTYPAPEIGGPRKTQNQDTGNKENLYDDPDATKPAAQAAAAHPQTSNSKLERSVPTIYVTSESDESEAENETTCSSAINPYKTSTEIGGAFSCNDVDTSYLGGDSSTGSFSFPNQHPLPTILEHPYHVLEQSGGVLFDMDYGVLQDHTESRTSNDIPHFSSGYKNEYYEYDRLVDPQLYSILDRSISNTGSSNSAVSNSGISRIYDIQSGPYSKIEPQSSLKQQQPKCKRVTNLDLSTDIFDDAQYVSPVPTPNLTNTGSVETVAKEDKKGRSKYFGDYERDPIYMENMLGEKPTDMYQPLEVSAMDPVQDYEKPQPSTGTNMATKY